MKRTTRSLLAPTIAVIAAISCQRGPSPEQKGGAGASTPAPDSFKVALETNKGRIVVQAVRAWAPQGVDRFYALVNDQYYDGVKFFRVLPNFMAQFGIQGDPAKNDLWKDRNIPDDPVVQSNKRGFVSFATSGPNSRTTQLFINKGDNVRLDGMGFAPFAHVVEGMGVVDSLNMEYGEGAPEGRGPAQGLIELEGNRYLNRDFPRLDSIVRARVMKD